MSIGAQLLMLWSYKDKRTTFEANQNPSIHARKTPNSANILIRNIHNNEFAIWQNASLILHGNKVTNKDNFGGKLGLCTKTSSVFSLIVTKQWPKIFNGLNLAESTFIIRLEILSAFFSRYLFALALRSYSTNSIHHYFKQIFW